MTKVVIKSLFAGGSESDDDINNHKNGVNSGLFIQQQAEEESDDRREVDVGNIYPDNNNQVRSRSQIINSVITAGGGEYVDEISELDASCTVHLLENNSDNNSGRHRFFGLDHNIFFYHDKSANNATTKTLNVSSFDTPSSNNHGDEHDDNDSNSFEDHSCFIVDGEADHTTRPTLHDISMKWMISAKTQSLGTFDVVDESKSEGSSATRIKGITTDLSLSKPISKTTATTLTSSNNNNNTYDMYDHFVVDRKYCRTAQENYSSIKLKADKERLYLRRTVANNANSYGLVSVKTAESLMQLGHTYEISKEYSQAICTYQSACNIWMHFGEKYQLAVATGMDKIGSALLMQMGDYYINSKQYSQAVKLFHAVYKVRRALLPHNNNENSINIKHYNSMITDTSTTTDNNSNSSSTRLTRAMDQIGLVWKKASGMKQEDYRQFMNVLDTLQQAYEIRCNVLGKKHIDTIDTKNKIAAVYLHLCQFEKALQIYLEVFYQRKAIFNGSNHPSIAVTAQVLGHIYSILAQKKLSNQFYSIALSIYDSMENELPDNHPSVALLLQDSKTVKKWLLENNNNTYTNHYHKQRLLLN